MARELLVLRGHSVTRLSPATIITRAAHDERFPAHRWRHDRPHLARRLDQACRSLDAESRSKLGEAGPGVDWNRDTGVPALLKLLYLLVAGCHDGRAGDRRLRSEIGDIVRDQIVIHGDGDEC